jgi:hypothetical protein
MLSSIASPLQNVLSRFYVTQAAPSETRNDPPEEQTFNEIEIHHRCSRLKIAIWFCGNSIAQHCLNHDPPPRRLLAKVSPDLNESQSPDRPKVLRC